jgi:hypothetical protein
MVFSVANSAFGKNSHDPAFAQPRDRAQIVAIRPIAFRRKASTARKLTQHRIRKNSAIAINRSYA